MTAAALNLTVEKYATFKLDLQIKNGQGEAATPADITDYEPRMQIRKSATDAEVLFELTTENGRIVVTDAAAGKLTVKLAAADTFNIGWASAVYDLVLIGASETKRIIQGTVSVSDGVTR